MELNSATQCRYIKSDGSGCQANVQAGSEFCFFHDPALAQERATARSEGGRERTRKVLLPPNTPPVELKTTIGVVQLLEETINQVRRGEIDLRASNAIGYLAGILLTAIEKGALEERLAALETIVAGQDRKAKTHPENHTFDFIPEEIDGPSLENDQPETFDSN